jgi:hypothetical protein
MRSPSPQTPRRLAVRSTPHLRGQSMQLFKTSRIDGFTPDKTYFITRAAGAQ